MSRTRVAVVVLLTLALAGCAAESSDPVAGSGEAPEPKGWDFSAEGQVPSAEELGKEGAEPAENIEPDETAGLTAAEYKVYYGTSLPTVMPLRPGQIWAVGWFHGCSGLLINCHSFCASMRSLKQDATC